MRTTRVSGLSAVALMVLHSAAQTQQTASGPVPLGPGSEALILAPKVVSFEPASGDAAAAEPGRLFITAELPEAAPTPSAGSPLILRFSAPGAEAYRLYFEGLGLPEGSRMFLYGLDAAGHVTATFGPYERSGPLPDGSFRSRIVPGVEVALEIQGMGPGPWPMRIPWIAALNAGLLAELRAAGDAGLTETPDQRHPASGERIQVEFEGRMVSAQVIDGDIVLEGDMVIGSVSAEKSRSANFNPSPSAHWPGGVIPFVDNLPDTRGQVARDHWAQATKGVITFVPRTSEASFVRFVQPSGNICSTDIMGRSSGMTTIKLGPTCSAGNAKHEIGHALGFHHEQNRTDRDSFVRILWPNVQSIGFQDQFVKSDGDPFRDFGGYDFGSIMHYPLAISGVPVMETLVTPPPGVTIGQRAAISSGDFNTVNTLYGVRVSPGTLNVPASGGTFSVAVNAAADRFWVAKDTADWVTTGPVISGTGPGTVQFTVAPYTGTSQLSRTANLNIALTPALEVNATLSIAQAAPGCTFGVTPLLIDAPPEVGTYTVRITTQSTCTWGVTESLNWLTASPATGQGSATITVRLTSANYSLNFKAPDRRGSITVAGRKVDVIQRGGCLTCAE